MVKFVEDIYHFTSSMTGKRYGAYVVSQDGNKHVVIEQEGKMYVLSHYIDRAIKDCFDAPTDSVVNLINNNIKE